MTPYYDRDGIQIWHGDSRDISAWESGDVMVTDPPYGIAYRSGQHSTSLRRSIAGDEDTTLRDAILDKWGDRPALVFGTWKTPAPDGTKMVLIWDTRGALGMGDLSIPWKPSHQQICVLGKGFSGRRTTDVLSFPPVQSMARNGRVHPHEKPVDLMRELVSKCPEDAVIADPFMGTGPVARACADLGRRYIGVELVEDYCRIAVGRLSQQSLDLYGSWKERTA